MSVPLDLAYLIAAPVVLPALAVKSLRTGKYQSDLAGRFGIGGEAFRKPAGSRLLMLHCVSMGELNSVTTLVERLLAADPELYIAITTTTDTGTERARKLYGGGGGNGKAMPARVVTARFPFDFSFAVEGLLDRLQPDLIALVELETWPNFLSIAKDRRIPVALINGRISEKSFPRYRAIEPLMAAMLRKVAWIGAQTPTIAGRFRVLGAEQDRVEVLPTLKYDNAPVADHVAGQEALAAAMGLATGGKLFVGGSTGPGEEDILLDAYLKIRAKDTGLRLAIVPRHPEVVPRVVEAIRARKLQPVLRSDRPDGGAYAALGANDVLVLNTMGELRKLYALAFAVFVGRSFFKKGGGGSDMIEVAALGRPCCFGPYTANFAEVVELLLERQTAVRVQDGWELEKLLDQWLARPAAAVEMGLRAREVIRGQQGSTDRYVEKLFSLMTRKLTSGRHASASSQ